MRKNYIWIFMLIMMLLIAGCGDKSPAAAKESSGAEKETSSNNGTSTNIGSSSGAVKGEELILPDSYPKEILPLAPDAEIIDVREDPASNVLEVMYVSDNNINTLCDFYEGVLKDAKNLITDETSDGYWITANMDGVDYSILLSKDAMNSNPQYAGKISAYIILSALEDISSVIPQIPEGKGETWPAADLFEVPQLKGHISQILREDGIIRLEITVEDAENVKNYISELKAAGFSFDTEPDLEANHMEFLAFKESSMMSFAYKGEENAVSIEYQK